MAITVVQTAGPTSDTGTPATISQAFASNVTAGNTVIALVYGANWPAASTDNITASDGTSYTQAIKSGALTDDKTLCAIFYRDNHPGGACTVTATPSSAAQRMQIVLIEVSGLDTTNSLEDTTTASGTGTAVDAGNLVTAGDAILIQMSVANSGYTSISAGTNFVSVGFTVTWTGVIGERRIVTGAGTYATPSTINTSSQWQAIGAAFKAGAGGAASITAAQGSYSITGQTTTSLKVARVLSAAQGSYSLTGQNAALTYEQPGVIIMPAAYGTYTITGSDGLAQRAMNAGHGTYTITGIPARLRYSGEIIPAQVGVRIRVGSFTGI